MEKKQIDLLIYMLEDIRKVTLKGVSGLTKEQLFQEPITGEFPIGAYIMHLGECDLYWLSVMSGEKLPEDLQKRLYSDVWFDCKPENLAPPKSAPEIDEYINPLTDARLLLKNYVGSLSDENLEEVVTVKWSMGEKHFSKKWIVYHLIEHEAHTRGQMFLLIRMAGFKKKGENN